MFDGVSATRPPAQLEGQLQSPQGSERDYKLTSTLEHDELRNLSYFTERGTLRVRQVETDVIAPRESLREFCLKPLAIP
jgi:hypothetical protein